MSNTDDKDSLIDESLFQPLTKPAQSGSFIDPEQLETQFVPDPNAIKVDETQFVPTNPELNELGHDQDLPQAEWGDLEEGKFIKGSLNTGTGGVIRSLGETSTFGESLTSALDVNPFLHTTENSKFGEAVKGIKTLLPKVIDNMLGTAKEEEDDNFMTRFGDHLSEHGQLQMAESTKQLQGKRLSFWQEVYLTSLNSTAQMMPGLVAAYAGRGRTGAFNFTKALAVPVTITYGHAYDEARRSGLSIPDANTHAVFQAGVEGTLERLGFAPLETLTTSMKKALIKSILAETGTEVATEVIQALGESVMLEKDMTAKEVAYRALVAAAAAGSQSTVVNPIVLHLQQKGFEDFELSVEELELAGVKQQDLVRQVDDSTFEIANSEMFPDGTVSGKFFDLSDTLLTDISNGVSREVLARKALDRNLIGMEEYNNMVANEAEVRKNLPKILPMLQEEGSSGLRNEKNVFLFEDQDAKKLQKEQVRVKAQEKFKSIVENAADGIAMSIIPQRYMEIDALRNQLENQIEKAADRPAKVQMDVSEIANLKLDQFRMPAHKQKDNIVLPEEQIDRGFKYLPPKNKPNQLPNEAEEKFIKVMSRFAKKYLPNTAIYFSTDKARHLDSEGNQVDTSRTFGHTTSLGDNSVLLHISPSELTKNSLPINASVLLHEFAHTFLHTYITQQSPEFQQGILNELLQQRERIQNESVKDFLIQDAGMVGYNKDALMREDFDVTKVNEMEQGIRNYILMPHEIFARTMEGQFARNPSDQNYLRNAAMDYKKMFDELADGFGIEPLKGNELLGNAFKHAELKAEKERIIKALTRKPEKGLVHKDGMKDIVDGMPKEVQEELPEEASFMLDKFDFRHRFLVNLTQIIKNNQHIPEMVTVGELARAMQQKTNHWQIQANKRVTQWRHLGKSQSDALARFLYNYTTQYDGKPSTEEIMLSMDNYKLEAQTKSVALGVIQDMTDVINEMEVRVIEQAQMIQDPDERATQMEIIQEEYATMKQKAYFPLTRFGKHSLTMKALEPIHFNGRKYPKGATLLFSTFEGIRDSSKAFKDANKRYKNLIKTGKVRVQKSELAEEEQIFLNMPPEFVRTVAKKMDLSEEQIKSLSSFLFEMSPAQSFSKHFNKRKELHGYSEDAMRTYADYMFRFSRHAARLEYSDQILETVNHLQNRSNTMADTMPSIDTSKRQNLINYLRRWHDYLMNPENEWAHLRSFGFFWYLGYVPKAAVLNLSQLGLAAYPALASMHGDAKSVKHLTKAMKDAFGNWEKGKLPAEDKAALAWGVDSGFLDESDAAVLSGAATGGVLSRGIARSKVGRGMEFALRHASDMFHATETFGRRTTFLAALRLAREKGLPESQARLEARGVVDDTMFEYARWARPELLRGKKSIFFLFHQFGLSMTRFMFGGNKGWWRSWLVVAAVAGLQGLPFAEDLLDLLDYAYKKFTGDYSDIRTEARKYVQEVGANPDLVMHGLGRYTTGMTNEFGLPLPYLDMSGSLSMGSPFPAVTGTVEAVTGNRGLAQGVAEGSGALVSLPFVMMDAMKKETPDPMYTSGKLMPKFMQGTWNAIVAADRGHLPDSKGRPLVPYDITNGSHLSEMLAMVGGFQPTRKSQAYELLNAQNKVARFWQDKRGTLIADLNFAYTIKDQEAKADAWAAIRKFNNDVPWKTFAITADALVESIRNHKVEQLMREAGLTYQKNLIPVYQEVLKQYPQLRYQSDDEE